MFASATAVHAESLPRYMAQNRVLPACRFPQRTAHLQYCRLVCHPEQSYHRVKCRTHQNPVPDGFALRSAQLHCQWRQVRSMSLPPGSICLVPHRLCYWFPHVLGIVTLLTDCPKGVQLGWMKECYSNLVMIVPACRCLWPLARFHLPKEVLMSWTLYKAHCTQLCTDET